MIELDEAGVSISEIADSTIKVRVPPIYLSVSTL